MKHMDTTTITGTSVVTGTMMKPTGTLADIDTAIGTDVGTDVGTGTSMIKKEKKVEKKKKRSNRNYILLLSVIICMIISMIVAFIAILVTKKTNVHHRTGSRSSRSNAIIGSNLTNNDVATTTTTGASSTSSITDAETDSDSDTDVDVDVDTVPSSPFSSSIPTMFPVNVKANNTKTKTNITLNTTTIGNTSDPSTISPTAIVQSMSPIGSIKNTGISITPTTTISQSPSTLTSSLISTPTPTSTRPPSLKNSTGGDDEVNVPNDEELYYQLFNIMKVPKEFRIKMHWEKQYFWQEEVMERQWCIECTTCPYLNFDLTNTECDIVRQCTIGNQIWIVPCEYNYGNIFTIKPLLLPIIPITARSRRPTSSNHTRSSKDKINNDNDQDYNDYYYHQIQIVQNETTFNVGVYNTANNNTNKTTHQVILLLCLERTETRYVTVQQCQEYDTNNTYFKNNKDTYSNNSNYYYTPQQLAQLWEPLVPYNNNDSLYWNSNNTDNSSYSKSTNNTLLENIANDGMIINTTTYFTFTLTPAILLDSDIIHNQTSWCLTNQHHPKSEEIVALKPCTISDKWNTGYWNIFPIP
jgi:hypothetical protein